MGKSNPKTVFWTAYFITLLALSLMVPVGLEIVNRLLFGGKQNLGVYGSAVIGLSVVLSPVVANLVCRRMGVSREERKVEVITRNQVIPNSSAIESAEIRYSAEIWRGFGYFLVPFSLLILVLTLVLPAKEGTQIYGFILAGAFGVAAGFCWLAYFRKFGFIGRADEAGISSLKSGGVSVQTVSWNEIESCEITTFLDAMGNLAQTRFVFKSKRNFILLQILAMSTSLDEIARFRTVVEHHLSASAKAN